MVERLKTHSYKPQAVKRVYIPKGDGKEKRPLGILAYEDKIVQNGLNKILQAIYKQVLAIILMGSDLREAAIKQ